jgi:hypothetical protein
MFVPWMQKQPKSLRNRWADASALLKPQHDTWVKRPMDTSLVLLC